MRKAVVFISIVMTIISCKDAGLTKVEDVFYEFNEANIATDGNKIYELTDTKTHQYYSNLLDMVIEYDSVEVSNLNIIDKINILSSRAVLSDSLLLNIDAKDFMIKMYTKVNTMDDEKKKATRSMKIKNIKITQNSAKGELTDAGRSLADKVYIEFNKENGEWKYNILSMYEFTETTINTMLSQNGMTHSDFIDLIFSDPSVQAKLVKTPNESWNSIK